MRTRNRGQPLTGRLTSAAVGGNSAPWYSYEHAIGLNRRLVVLGRLYIGRSLVSSENLRCRQGSPRPDAVPHAAHGSHGQYVANCGGIARAFRGRDAGFEGTGLVRACLAALPASNCVAGLQLRRWGYRHRVSPRAALGHDDTIQMI